MRQRLHPTNAARQKAYRDRNRNAVNRNAGIYADAARLAPRIRALDSCWILRVSDDGRELDLIGNGPPAAWQTVASCEVWIERRERYRKQHKRRREADEEED